VLAKAFPVEGGVTTPGTITVKATAEGLKDATITLTTKPFVSENGLSKVLPSAGLPSRLQRGLTPATASYTVTRTPIAIVSATAGANTDSTTKSYDDNEPSGWVNDGKLNTAWTEYSLEREATVSEITLKLNNFRSRVYPLIVTVDGKEAFSGKHSNVVRLLYY
jgi:beta-galactosidase